MKTWVILVLWAIGLVLALPSLYILLFLPTVSVVVSPEEVATIVPNIEGVPEVIAVVRTTSNPSNSDGLIVIFDEAMDETTINQNTLIVVGQNNSIINGKLTYNINKNAWTFNPTNDFQPNSEYTIRITADAKSLSGVHLAEDFVSSFTVTSNSKDNIYHNQSDKNE